MGSINEKLSSLISKECGDSLKPYTARNIIDKFFGITNNDYLIKYLYTKFPDSRKIYKYCPIDESINLENNYSIINLNDNTIYLSEPREFNDPFDASIGLSEQVIYDQLLLGMLNKEYLEKSGLENFKITKNDFSTYEKFKETVEKMEKSLLKDFLSYYVASEQRYKELIFLKSIGNYEDIILHMFSDKQFLKRFLSNLINPDIYSESNIEKLIVLFSEDNIRKLSQQNMQVPMLAFSQKENLFNKEIYYKQIEGLGFDKKILDDAINKIRQTLADFSIKIADYINLNIGISCFSETHDNELMWSHYANKHKGFCVEYDMNVLIEKDPKIAALLFPVIYTKDRPIIDKSIISSFNIKDGKLDLAPSANKYFTRALMTKSKIWRYEKEWRVISKVINNRAIKFDCVSAIYLGSKASINLRNYMKKFCSGKISLYQYSIDIETYKLNLVKLK